MAWGLIASTIGGIVSSRNKRKAAEAAAAAAAVPAVVPAAKTVGSALSGAAAGLAGGEVLDAFGNRRRMGSRRRRRRSMTKGQMSDFLFLKANGMSAEKAAAFALNQKLM